MAFELTSFADLKSLLKLKKLSITDYPELSVIKASVEAAIEGFLGRSLESISRTESIYISLCASRMVPLKGLPVATITSITLTDNLGEDETLSAPDDYRITPYGIRLSSKVTDMDISVIYTGGYTRAPTDTLPAEIARAALLQTAYEWQSKSHIGASSVTSEGGSITRPQIQLLKEVKARLYAHRHPSNFSV